MRIQAQTPSVSLVYPLSSHHACFGWQDGLLTSFLQLPWCQPIRLSQAHWVNMQLDNINWHYSSHLSCQGQGYTQVLLCITKLLIYSFSASFSLRPFSSRFSLDLQEVHAASARRWRNPDKAEAGGGLVADVGSHDAANKLGSTKLTLWHYTWRREDKQGKWEVKTKGEFLYFVFLLFTLHIIF